MFIMPLDLFVKETITPIKELKKKFEKSSDDVDSALSRYMSKKPKDPTLQESAKELADTRKTFHKVYMEYVSKLNDIEAKKKINYMENVSKETFNKSKMVNGFCCCRCLLTCIQNLHFIIRAMKY